MAITGIDNFELIRKLSKKEDGASLNDVNAASSLSSLAVIVSLDTVEYNTLSLDDNVKNGIEGAPASRVFRELPVLLPKAEPEARRSGSKTAYNISYAITVLCPFVGDEVKVLEESPNIRHSAEECAPKGQQRLKIRSYFTWSFAHLVEAILFKNVVLYDPSGTIPNLQASYILLGRC